MPFSIAQSPKTSMTIGCALKLVAFNPPMTITPRRFPIKFAVDWRLPCECKKADRIAAQLTAVGDDMRNGFVLVIARQIEIIGFSQLELRRRCFAFRDAVFQRVRFFVYAAKIGKRKVFKFNRPHIQRFFFRFGAGYFENVTATVPVFDALICSSDLTWTQLTANTEKTITGINILIRRFHGLIYFNIPRTASKLPSFFAGVNPKIRHIRL